MLKGILNYFELEKYQTTVGTEIVAGITTFLTMVYIIFVNPTILSAAGIDVGSAFVATCLAAAIGCVLIGILANYPIAIAPGMGLNKVLIEAIPKSLVFGITAGIGFFLGVIGLKNAGIIVSDPNTLVKLGDISSIPALLFLLGFSLIIVLSHFRIIGAIIISILTITILSLLLKLTSFAGIVSLPPDPSSTLLALDIKGALYREGPFIIFAFFLVVLFDNTGTIIGVLQETQFLKDKDRMQRLSKGLMADSIATMAGSLLGTSTTTSYVESAAGVRAGGRTGLTAIVAAILFFRDLNWTLVFFAIIFIAYFLLLKYFVH